MGYNNEITLSDGISDFFYEHIFPKHSLHQFEIKKKTYITEVNQWFNILPKIINFNDIIKLN